jgi:hypothetical protein
MIERSDLIYTPQASSIRKPTIATPIHRWNHPRRVAKARQSPVVKKLTDKSGKLNKNLSNFFTPLMDPLDNSEQQMQDDDIQM